MITTKSAEERQRFWDLLAELKPAREAMKKATLVKAQIVDIPFARFEPQPEVPRCRFPRTRLACRRRWGAPWTWC